MLNLSDNATPHSTAAASGAQHGSQIDGAAAEEGDHSKDAEEGVQEGQNEEAGWTDDDSEEEDVEWQVVAKSQNSARRKKRRVPPLPPSFSTQPFDLLNSLSCESFPQLFVEMLYWVDIQL